MSEFEPTIRQQNAMADFLIAAVLDDATGVSDGDRRVGEPPSARYFLGTLAPSDLNLSANGQRRGRETPTSCGFEFEVAATDPTFTINATASVYYRVWPTFAEQLAYAGGDLEPQDRIGKDFRLAPAFQRVQVETGDVEVRVRLETPIQDVAVGQFAAALSEAQDVARRDPTLVRRVGSDSLDLLIPGQALQSEADFIRWLDAQQGDAVIPDWAAKISVLTRPLSDDRLRVVALLENVSQDPVVVRRVRGVDVERHDDARDHFLFQVLVEVHAEPGIIVPIQMNLGPDAYRYDRELPAYATNCGVEHDVDDAGHITVIRSAPAPVHQTRRTPPNDHPSARFEVLSTDPLPALEGLLHDMRAYSNSVDWSTDGLPDALAETKRRDREAFEKEVERFADGVRWLQTDQRLLLAFRLANRTMLRMDELTGKRHAAWRLFQVVFIVSQVPALAWREHEPSLFTPGLWGAASDRDPTAAASILYYPTSGGKTEAYLGLIATACFYDRARGKLQGTTAWCRFPLRLLTLQQTQRQLDLIAAAEDVRRDAVAELEAVGGAAGDQFAIGFFAGEGNTPNSLSRDQRLLDRLVTDADRRLEVRVIDECPYCRQRTVEVPPPDANELRLKHVCTTCNRELPVYVVDTEIYRYLPALIVGTLDKLAMIGLSDRFGAILGDVESTCSIHGFARGMKCHERRAQGHPDRTIAPLADPLYDASPSLEIVDELHMVRENLGAFGGHYESILAVEQGLLSARTRPDHRSVRMKVIATTATIEGEDRQTDHLFGLRSVVMPLPGPSLERSFYWTMDEGPLRRFVGVLPHRATAELALVRILQALHAAVRSLETSGPSAVPGLDGIVESDWDRLLDLYRVTLTYVTSLVDFGKLRRSMDTQVNESLRERGLRPVQVRELSGDSKFNEVRETLDDLKEGGPTEAVVATSMISHGVDVDRLNVMVFNGMPKSMAEYIQASSRVGRSWLGVVFMIFNPVRERDRSHFRYHGKFHEYLDRMVEPVAINRWSRFAARKTLPGLFMAHVLQNVNRAFWDSGAAPQHLHDLVRMQRALRPPDNGGLAEAQTEPILSALAEAYMLSREEAAELRDELEQHVRAAISSIRAAGAAAGAAVGARTQYRATGDYLGLEYDAMTSLRDVAEGLPFYVLAERRRS